jgi:hypothetical protein
LASGVDVSEFDITTRRDPRREVGASRGWGFGPCNEPRRLFSLTTEEIESKTRPAPSSPIRGSGNA